VNAILDNLLEAEPTTKLIQPRRRFAVGAEIVPAGVDFRVWAPGRTRVAVVLERGTHQSVVTLAAAGDGYFAGTAIGAFVGTRYRFRLDDDAKLYPDPASRFQPEGPHGPSEVVDAAQFMWTDQAWRGVPPASRVLYELHVGTFTREGTWAAAARELSELAQLGITVVQLMPIADFPGRFGWGYDGVNLFAPCRLYGTPDDFREFVDHAHAEGIAVILDVVYNHFGPDGCYLRAFSEDYFTDRYDNDWGDPINFDGENAGPVREYFVANTRYWIEEFHLDGLRLDATQQVYDATPEHIIAAVTRQVRLSSGDRESFVLCENEPQEVKLVQPRQQGGYGADALLNDDFHHSAVVSLTGKNEAYYTDYAGTPQEFISAIKWGYLYQGQHYKWQKQARGTPAFGLDATAFVHFLENHDQVANSAYGDRMHKLSSPGRYRAMTALLLLAPQTPLLFQGQEFAASTPFLYFADHAGELASAVRNGRAEFLMQFPSIALPAVQAVLDDPSALRTFERCKLDLSEREKHAAAYGLHRDLLQLRRSDPVFSAAGRRTVDGAVLGAEALVLRFFSEEGGDRLLIVNLGGELELDIAPEPLLAPCSGSRWRTAWSSDAPRYGGYGVAPIESDSAWRIPAQTALVLAPAPALAVGPVMPRGLRAPRVPLPPPQLFSSSSIPSC
jgi:maltooligosyltrehalose trehalohydrolase